MTHDYRDATPDELIRHAANPLWDPRALDEIRRRLESHWRDRRESEMLQHPQDIDDDRVPTWKEEGWY